MAWTFLALAVVIGVASVRAPWMGVAGGFAVWIGVPFAVGVAAEMPLGLQPGAWVVVACVAALLVTRPRMVLHDVLDAAPSVIACALFVGVAAVTTQVFAPGGMGTVLNMVAVPMLGFGLIRHVLRDPMQAVPLRRAILLIAAAEALVAIAVRFGALPQPWSEQLAAAYRWFTSDFVRAMGTTDSPLVLVAVFTLAAPLLVAVRSTMIRFALGATFVFATVMTESRSGLVIVTLGFLFAVLRGTGSAWGRLLMLLVTVGILGLVASSSIADAVLEKFVDDGGSANARSNGWAWALENLHRFTVTGFGAGSSFALTSALPTSLESPLFMYLPDFGLPATVLFFVTAVAIILWKRHEARPLPGGVLAGMGTLLHMVTFSSIAAFSAAGGILWMALAFAAAPLGRPAPLPGTATESLPQTTIRNVQVHA